jgi:hypothetical protein
MNRDARGGASVHIFVDQQNECLANGWKGVVPAKRAHESLVVTLDPCSAFA